MFPVKLGLFAILMLATSGCGYHAAYGGDAPAYRLTVSGAALHAPYPEALQAALAGARAELAKTGVLASGTGYPRLVVELVRVDEMAAGIAAVETARGSLPLARSTAVGVVVRGWVLERDGAPPTRDSGDVRRVETIAETADVALAGAHTDDALTAAGRAAGEAVARRVVGIAEPAVSPL